MRRIRIDPRFEAWQTAARSLLRERIPPTEVQWEEAPQGRALLASEGSEDVADTAASPAIRVPRRFLELARSVAGHPSPERWGHLYRVLWRLQHEDRRLLERKADGDIRTLTRLEEEVRSSRILMREAPGQAGLFGAAALGPPAVIAEAKSLEELRTAAARCTGCELHRNATQTVFGQGPAHARLALVGEQPGDQEDLQGAPFVGPAGQVLDRALGEAGLARSDVYVTNVVKHFKFTLRGKRRLHETPQRLEIVACLPWLEAELKLVEPEVLVCLGATAARAIVSPSFALLRERGRFFATAYCAHTLATLHPSAVLRAGDPEAERRLYELLKQDLTLCARSATSTSPHDPHPPMRST